MLTIGAGFDIAGLLYIQIFFVKHTQTGAVAPYHPKGCTWLGRVLPTIPPQPQHVPLLRRRLSSRAILRRCPIDVCPAQPGLASDGCNLERTAATEQRL